MARVGSGINALSRTDRCTYTYEHSAVKRFAFFLFFFFKATETKRK